MPVLFYCPFVHRVFETDNSDKWLWVYSLKEHWRKNAAVIRLARAVVVCILMYCDLNVSFCDETDKYPYLASKKNGT